MHAKRTEQQNGEPSYCECSPKRAALRTATMQLAAKSENHYGNSTTRSKIRQETHSHAPRKNIIRTHIVRLASSLDLGSLPKHACWSPSVHISLFSDSYDNYHLYLREDWTPRVLSERGHFASYGMGFTPSTTLGTGWGGRETPLQSRHLATAVRHRARWQPKEPHHERATRQQLLFRHNTIHCLCLQQKFKYCTSTHTRRNLHVVHSHAIVLSVVDSDARHKPQFMVLSAQHATHPAPRSFLVGPLAPSAHKNRGAKRPPRSQNTTKNAKYYEYPGVP